jgi:dihydropteroate synthase
MLFSARNHRFEFPGPTVVMGILNLTPDSFSDGGRWGNEEAALDRALIMVAEGAGIIDVGGESTRPGALPVAESEELRRVVPVIEKLVARPAVPMKPGVARAALDAGASIVNDVAANRLDGEMWELVAACNAGYVCMHMQGTPKTMQLEPVYEDVCREVAEFFVERLACLNRCGVGTDQVIFDPGIGFGKTPEHNVRLVGAMRRFSALGRPLLLGVSRKSFLSKYTGVKSDSRLPAGLACACVAVEAGARFIRTHDVAETVQAIRMTEAILKSGDNEWMI